MSLLLFEILSSLISLLCLALALKDKKLWDKIEGLFDKEVGRGYSKYQMIMGLVLFSFIPVVNLLGFANFVVQHYWQKLFK